jgi:hypothetical protein
MRRFLYLAVAVFVIAALSQAKMTVPQRADLSPAAASVTMPAPVQNATPPPALQLPPELAGNADPHPFAHEFYPAPEQQKTAARHLAKAR